MQIKNIFKKKKISSKEELIALAMQDISNMRLAPRALRNESLYRDLVMLHPDALKYVPKKFQTHFIYLNAVNAYGTSICHINKKYLKNDICVAAINNSPIAFKYIPEELQTYKLSLLTVSKDPVMFKYIPFEHRTVELCKVAITNPATREQVIPRVPLNVLADHEFIRHELALMEAEEKSKRKKEAKQQRLKNTFPKKAAAKPCDKVLYVDEDENEI
ncbi:MAG: DUF4116 domain-containing protein [Clostridia bacterium]|nr:DUF4116 domain-containing protein [Clostridia bacterium]